MELTKNQSVVETVNSASNNLQKKIKDEEKEAKWKVRQIKCWCFKKNVKAYKKKLKSHGGSVLAVYSPKGRDGFEIISGATDQNVRSKVVYFLKNLVWRLEKSKILPMIEVLKPTEEELYPYKEKVGKLVNYAEGHVLNTPQALRKVTGSS